MMNKDGRCRYCGECFFKLDQLQRHELLHVLEDVREQLETLDQNIEATRHA